MHQFMSLLNDVESKCPIHSTGELGGSTLGLFPYLQVTETIALT